MNINGDSVVVYYSVLSLDELADIPRGERAKFIGVILDGKILQPAKCYDCESEIVILEEDTTRSQCSSCGILNDVYFFDNYNPLMAKTLPAGFVGVTFHEDIMR